MTHELLTADELLALNIQDKRTELIRGRLVVREPAGLLHGMVSAEIARLLGNFVKARQLGMVLGAETGFRLFTGPDTVRAPDSGFIRADRIPSPLPRNYPALAPDLAVEVLSPGDRPGAVLAKVADWITAGTRLVWIIDPERRYARVYRADGSERLVAEHESLYGEDVLEGFSCTVAQLLPV